MGTVTNMQAYPVPKRDIGAIRSKVPTEDYKKNYDIIFSRKEKSLGKVYLAGPMRGIKDFNFPAFFAAADELRANGYEVFNPAERDTKEWGADNLKTATGSETEVSERLGKNGLSLARECFLADTEFICKHADAIALLPGWENSKGAKAEKALCEAIGLGVIIL